MIAIRKAMPSGKRTTTNTIPPISHLNPETITDLETNQEESVFNHTGSIIAGDLVIPVQYRSIKVSQLLSDKKTSGPVGPSRALKLPPSRMQALMKKHGCTNHHELDVLIELDATFSTEGLLILRAVYHGSLHGAVESFDSLREELTACLEQYPGEFTVPGASIYETLDRLGRKDGSDIVACETLAFAAVFLSVHPALFPVLISTGEVPSGYSPYLIRILRKYNKSVELYDEYLECIKTQGVAAIQLSKVPIKKAQPQPQGFSLYSDGDEPAFIPKPMRKPDNEKSVEASTSAMEKKVDESSKAGTTGDYLLVASAITGAALIEDMLRSRDQSVSGNTKSSKPKSLPSSSGTGPVTKPKPIEAIPEKTPEEIAKETEAEEARLATAAYQRALKKQRQKDKKAVLKEAKAKERLLKEEEKAKKLAERMAKKEAAAAAKEAARLEALKKTQEASAIKSAKEDLPSKDKQVRKTTVPRKIEPAVPLNIKGKAKSKMTPAAETSKKVEKSPSTSNLSSFVPKGIVICPVCHGRCKVFDLEKHLDYCLEQQEKARQKAAREAQEAQKKGVLKAKQLKDQEAIEKRHAEQMAEELDRAREWERNATFVPNRCRSTGDVTSSKIVSKRSGRRHGSFASVLPLTTGKVLTAPSSATSSRTVSPARHSPTPTDEDFPPLPPPNSSTTSGTSSRRTSNASRRKDSDASSKSSISNTVDESSTAKPSTALEDDKPSPVTVDEHSTAKPSTALKEDKPDSVTVDEHSTAKPSTALKEDKPDSVTVDESSTAKPSTALKEDKPSPVTVDEHSTAKPSTALKEDKPDSVTVGESSTAKPSIALEEDKPDSATVDESSTAKPSTALEDDESGIDEASIAKSFSQAEQETVVPSHGIQQRAVGRGRGLGPQRTPRLKHMHEPYIQNDSAQLEKRTPPTWEEGQTVDPEAEPVWPADSSEKTITPTTEKVCSVFSPDVPSKVIDVTVHTNDSSQEPIIVSSDWVSEKTLTEEESTPPPSAETNLPKATDVEPEVLPFDAPPQASTIVRASSAAANYRAEWEPDASDVQKARDKAKKEAEEAEKKAKEPPAEEEEWVPPPLYLFGGSIEKLHFPPGYLEQYARKPYPRKNDDLEFYMPDHPFRGGPNPCCGRHDPKAGFPKAPQYAPVPVFQDPRPYSSASQYSGNPVGHLELRQQAPPIQLRNVPQNQLQPGNGLPPQPYPVRQMDNPYVPGPQPYPVRQMDNSYVPGPQPYTVRQMDNSYVPGPQPYTVRQMANPNVHGPQPYPVWQMANPNIPGPQPYPVWQMANPNIPDHEHHFDGFVHQGGGQYPRGGRGRMARGTLWNPNT